VFVKRVASVIFINWISKPVVSKSAKYAFTFLISSASCALFSSNQNTAGIPSIFVLSTVKRTQSRIGISLTRDILQISPASHSKLIITVPSSAATVTVPDSASSNVVGCEPYSSAF